MVMNRLNARRLALVPMVAVLALGGLPATGFAAGARSKAGKPAIDLESISGDVSIEQIESERVKVNSISGDVIFRGKLSKTGRYDLSTNSGDVQVITDGGANFEVEARTFSGDVSSDFAMKLGTLPSSFAGNGRGARRNNDIRGIVNDGGALLSLHSFSGDILITKR